MGASSNTHTSNFTDISFDDTVSSGGGLITPQTVMPHLLGDPEESSKTTIIDEEKEQDDSSDSLAKATEVPASPTMRRAVSGNYNSSTCH